MSKRELKLYCFSPPVMLATFIIETGLAVYTVWRYKFNEIGRLATALLVFLAIFQLAEYNVCATGWVDSLTASRIGYVAITMLPPLGIHLTYAIGAAKRRRMLLPAYATAAAFITFFLTIGHSLTGHACLGNYIIFQMAPDSVWLYALYYYGWLVAGVGLCFYMAKAQPAHKKALVGLAAGYLLFLIPTTTVNVIDPSTIKGIPSLMCGFAVLLAVVLATYVLPKVGKKR